MDYKVLFIKVLIRKVARPRHKPQSKPTFDRSVVYLTEGERRSPGGTHPVYKKRGFLKRFK